MYHHYGWRIKYKTESDLLHGLKEWGNTGYNYYIAAPHHKDIEPTLGDWYADEHGRVFKCTKGMFENERTSDYFYEHNLRIVRRSNKAFFMPKRERKDDN